jgi:transcriptional regulator with XRE-family HTH domain
MLHRERIKRERERLGMSYRAAAIAAGWGEDQASRWERVESGDTSDPGFTTLCGIADALGITLDELRENRPSGNVRRGVLVECLRIPELRGRVEVYAETQLADYRTANPPPVPVRRPRGRPRTRPEAP